MVAATSGAFYLLALACPVSMGLMMLFMGRGMGMGGKRRGGMTGGPGRDEQPLADLKAEQARLAEKISALEANSEHEMVEEAERTPA